MITGYLKVMQTVNKDCEDQVQSQDAAAFSTP